jgi:uncharacterized damage-inducible protein DinB
LLPGLVRHAELMSLPFPEPGTPAPSRAAVLLGYLDYFRSRLASKLESLPAAELRASRVPSGWTPIELLNHLVHVERRWMEWRFEGRDFADPWADTRDGRWYTAPGQTLAELVSALAAQAAQTRALAQSHDLSDLGQASDRWGGAGPAQLERVLLHLIQEYARHLGQLDIVSELGEGEVGE